MDTILPILSRWIHVGTAVVLVGGVVFMRYVLMPAASDLPDEAHNALRERVIGTWRKYVMAGILLLLVSGLYNYVLAIGTPRVSESKLYHPLMGVKIILALVVFFLASALVGRSPALEGIRQKRPLWLTVNIVLAAVIIAIAGYLKVAVK